LNVDVVFKLIFFLLRRAPDLLLSLMGLVVTPKLQSPRLRWRVLLRWRGFFRAVAIRVSRKRGIAAKKHKDCEIQDFLSLAYRLMSELGRVLLQFIAEGVAIASGVAASLAILLAIPDQVV
jgi:hypothetical protein